MPGVIPYQSYVVFERVCDYVAAIAVFDKSPLQFAGLSHRSITEISTVS